MKRLKTLLPSPWARLTCTVALASALSLAGCGGGTDDLESTEGGGVTGNGSGSGAEIVIAPLSGSWVGDYVSFTIQDGAIVGFEAKGLSCAQTDPAFASLKLCESDVVEGELSSDLQMDESANAITGAPEWFLTGKANRGDAVVVRDVSGLFTSSGDIGEHIDMVSGVFQLDMAVGDCPCQRSYTFTARFVPPEGWVPPGSDTPINPGVGVDDEDDPIGPGTVDFDPGVAPEDADAAQLAALEHVNWYRANVGLPPVNMHESLNQMATDHCSCYVQNADKYGNLSAHSEDKSWGPPCYGDLGERAAQVGYNNLAGEVMAFQNDPTGAVDGWMATLYHRYPLISPQTGEIGYGAGESGQAACDTINTGWASTAVPGAEVAYPYEGQVNVDTCWDGYESPQPPLPATESYPSGPIITLELEEGLGLNLDVAELLDSAGGVVPSQIQVSPQGSHSVGQEDSWLGREQMSIYAYSPLEFATEYTVRLEGTVNGAPWTKEWSFTTAPIKQGCWQ